MRPFLFLAALLVVFHCNTFAQDTAILQISSIPPGGFWLVQNWKYQAGDNPQWAKFGFDDSKWQGIEPTNDVRALSELWRTNIGWFRLHFRVDSIIAKGSLNLLVQQMGASEIYLNGQLIGAYGTLSSNPKQVQAVSPAFRNFIPFPVNRAGEQVLAVRFALQKNILYANFAGNPNPALVLTVIETQHISDYIGSNYGLLFDFSRIGLFFMLSILHLALYWYTPSQKANLYFFIYALLICLFFLSLDLSSWFTTFVFTKMILIAAGGSCLYLSLLFLLLAVYKTFQYRIRLLFWVIVAVLYTGMFTLGISLNFSYWFSNLIILLPLFEIIRVTVLSARKRQRGARIVIIGTISYIISFTFFNLIGFRYLPAGPNGIYIALTLHISFISIPISLSIYLALESSYTSRTLTEKLLEVQQLSHQTVMQEQEKQLLLFHQNERLEQQVTDRTASLNQSLQDLKETQQQLIQSEKMASLGELTAGIAHEIQNPLNFVNNFAETNVELLNELEQELKIGNIREAKSIAVDAIENEKKINHHGKRADAIVKSMLEHSRSSKGEKQPVDINALADEYLRLAYHGFRAKDKGFNANIQTDFDENIGKVNMVPQEIGRVLLNLFNNAFYAVAARKKQGNDSYEPTVTIRTRKLSNTIEVSIKDNGMGISKSVVDKIFQPFFTTKPSGEGTGLGLSLSYDILKAHGGDLRAISEEGHFAEFILQLPLTR